jgi:hypothetical protein
MFTPDPIRNPDIIEYPLGNTTARPPLPPFNPDDARFVIEYDRMVSQQVKKFVQKLPPGDLHFLNNVPLLK